MLWERVKLALVLVFFVGILIFTGSAQKDILVQSDPQVLNYLAAGYCPGVVQGGLAKPLEELNRVKREWEALAAGRHAQGLEGYQQAWKVRFLEMPSIGDARGSWALTRLMGGQAPEFMYSMVTPKYLDQCHKWYVDLSPYLSQKNPYAPDKYKRWIDTFYPNTLTNWRATADRHLYCIPVDRVEIAIYYNKTIFAKCGIDESELTNITWAKFIEIQQRIKDHGEVPFLMAAGNNMRVGWVRDILNDMLYAEIYKQVNAQDDPDQPGSTNVDPQEKVRAVRKGLAPIGDDRYWEAWRILKDWSQYWQKGALGCNDTMFFRRGKAAMTVDGSWYIKDLDNDKLRDFEYGFFFIPKLTKETSPFATGINARGVGGSTAIQYSLTRESVQNKQALQACVDLLMYVSAARNVGPMVAEGKSFLPTVKDTDEYFQNTRLKFMLPVIKAGPIQCTGFDDITPRSRNEWWAVMQEWLGGRLDRAQAVVKMNTLVEASIAEAMQEYKDQWKWMPGDQWEIPLLVSKLRPDELPTPDEPSAPESSPGSAPSSIPASNRTAEVAQ